MKMIYIYRVTAIFFLFLLFSCESVMEKSEKFQRPFWLEGKVYSVAQSVPELSTFVECVERTGFDDVINISGLYTVMAPTNTAFEEFFAQSTAYSSIDDIDSVTLKELVKMHIVLKSWSKDQMRLLNTETGGWIDADDSEAQFTGYKRETLLKPDNKSYKVQEVTGDRSIISPSGNATLVVYAEYNKYAPLFYREYMDYSDVTSSDFEYYYDRAFESAEIYYAGAQLLSTGVDLNEDGVIDESYAAENGYVYLIDKVIEPLQSAETFLTNTIGADHYYNAFGDVVNEFAIFSYNDEATYAQEGANEGLEIDKLYDIDYPSLAFNIASESTHSIAVNTIAYHNALFAPTNEAYTSFLEDVVLSGSGHYTEERNIPDVLTSAIVNAHMVERNPYYPSQTGRQGIISNALNEKIYESDVSAVETRYGSNATLVGVDKVIMPHMFESVAASMALRSTYSSFFAALNASNILTVVNNMDSEFTLLSISDASFERDSTFYIWMTDDLIDGYEFVEAMAYYNDGEMVVPMNIPLRSQENVSVTGLVSGQVAIGTPKGVCDKEYLRTLSNYYIEFDNVNGLVSGGEDATSGFMSQNLDLAIEQNLNVQLTEDYGSVYGTAPMNGKVYSIDTWLRFTSDCFTATSVKEAGQSVFYDLIKKAGLLNLSTYRFNFLEENEVLTVFVPSDEALATAQADTLEGDELVAFVKGHFVTGITMFTDNMNKNPAPDNYFTKNGTSIKLGSSSADEIDILTEDGSTYYSLHENGERTNNMYLGWDNGDDNDGSSIASKGQAGVYVVVHIIDKVIPISVAF